MDPKKLIALDFSFTITANEGPTFGVYFQNPIIMEQTGRKSTDQIDTDIFERLRKGETIAPDDPQAYKMRNASYATKKLLVQMNNSADPAEIRDLLSQITGSEMMKVRQCLRHFISIMGSTQRLVKMYLSILTVSSWI